MNTNSFVSDATEADFQEKVLVRSRTVPVLVDFWASWCEPCKTLGPILEKLAAEYAGQFELVKVDAEQNQRVGAAMRVQSVPTVYLIKDGQPIDGFAGAQPESAVRALLERHVELPAGDPLVMGQEALAAGRFDAAAQYFRQMIEDKPDDVDASLGLARLAFLVGEMKVAAGWLERIHHEHDGRDRLRGLFALEEFSGDESTLRAAVEANSGDVESWYSLGATLFLKRDFTGSIEAFLRTVALDRDYLDDGGRLRLLGLFELLGAEEPQAIQGRRRLAGLLF